MGESKIQSEFLNLQEMAEAIDTLVQSIESGNRGQTLFRSYRLRKNIHYGKYRARKNSKANPYFSS